MREFNTVISENGRVVIPAAIRNKLHLEPGDELVVTLSAENEIIFSSPKQSLAKLQKMFKSKKTKNLTDEVLNMRRKEEL